MKLRALDLFCGSGGATRGLQLAGYEVTGVDIRPMPRYCGDRFVQDDAMAWLRGEREPLDSFGLVWASPPCRRYSSITRTAGTRDRHPDLIGSVRDLLTAWGGPYIIENVEGAPLRNPLLLCGTMFGLLVIRHRLFETSPPLYFPPALCTHTRKVVKHGRRPNREQHYAAATGHFSDAEFVREAMEIDWMGRDELSQAIPPAYSRFLAEQIRAMMEAGCVAEHI
jgi:DNA (cytosine-5)-methyltransferase 1